MESMKTSNNAFSEALKGISKTMQQLGAGIRQSIHVLSQALVQPHGNLTLFNQKFDLLQCLQVLNCRSQNQNQPNSQPLIIISSIIF